jgi:uncharacterized protein YllA (UPF0747 family)
MLRFLLRRKFRGLRRRHQRELKALREELRELKTEVELQEAALRVAHHENGLLTDILDNYVEHRRAETNAYLRYNGDDQAE